MRISDDTAGRIVHLVSTHVEDVLERARALIAGYDDELEREIPAGTDIFDAHVHLGNDIDGFSGVYDDLERINDRYGIRRCFVFCMDEPDRHPAFRAANDRTLEHAKRSGGRLIPFVRLDLAEGSTTSRSSPGTSAARPASSSTPRSGAPSTCSACCTSSRRSRSSTPRTT